MSDGQGRATVVVIAGPSGAGKTTLTRHVTAALSDAVALFFDEYAAVSTYPRNIARWLAAGADANQFQTPRLAADIQMLRQGSTVRHPDGTTLLTPARYIILDDPFGRARQEMTPLIDVVVWIDISLNRALARRLQRDMTGGAAGGLVKRSAKSALYLILYAVVGRRFYDAVNAHARQSCDLVVDGTHSIDQITDQIVREVRRRARAP